MEPLAAFFKTITNDPRIGPSHISLYAALYYIWEQHDRCQPILVKRAQVMEMAKIAGVSTYHRIIHSLVDSGYITYEGGLDRKGNRFCFQLAPAEV